jgi:tetratricopeptide (TPR) repeat protein
MLLVYALTLNHWVTPASLPLTAWLQGENEVPGPAEPVSHWLAWPCHFLPPARIPFAVNAFNALCAALTLVLLARSVALLPHDLHVSQQPLWTFQPPSLLSGWRAWPPLVLAVAMGGLQLAFWENSQAATGENFNVLLFAYVIRCLLEFNADPKDGWLLRGALVYGLAVANDAVLAAFFPALLAALIRVKQLYIFHPQFLPQVLKRRRRNPKAYKLDLSAFNLRLLWQIPGCWLAGWLAVFWLPAAAHFAPGSHTDFWPEAQSALHAWHAPFASISRPHLLAAALLPLLPFLLAVLRFGDFLTVTDRITFFVGAIFVQIVHGFLLLFCLWTMFDPPLSPHGLQMGALCLPLYYLVALGIGYYAGHFLMVTETRTEIVSTSTSLPASALAGAGVETAAETTTETAGETRHRKRRRKLKRVRKELGLIPLPVKYGLLVAGIGLSVGAPVALVCKNLPAINAQRGSPWAEYAGALAKALPAGGAVVLDRDAFRLGYLAATLIRDGRAGNYLLINPDRAASEPGYLSELRRRHPQFSQDFNRLAGSPTNGIPDALTGLIQTLVAAGPVYWAPPVPVDLPFAENDYFQNAGLLCQVLPYPAGVQLPVPPSASLLRDQAAFWQDFADRQLPALAGRISPVRRPAAGRLLHLFLATLRFSPEADPDAQTVAARYAVALNNWGVTLQRAGQFAAAGPCFDEALQLDPLNSAAQINQQFNADRLAGREAAALSPEDTVRSLGEYGDWQRVLAGGQVDEPNFCHLLGVRLAEQRLFHPALAEFDRVRQLAPGRSDNELSLARLLSDHGDPPGR